MLKDNNNIEFFISHLGVSHNYAFDQSYASKKWNCGYLDIHVATNVASEEILVDMNGLKDMDIETSSKIISNYFSLDSVT